MSKVTKKNFPVPKKAMVAPGKETEICDYLVAVRNSLMKNYKPDTSDTVSLTPSPTPSTQRILDYDNNSEALERVLSNRSISVIRVSTGYPLRSQNSQSPKKLKFLLWKLQT